MKMNWKNDQLYPLYENWVDEQKWANGKKKLALISMSLFEDFSKRYNNDPHFKDVQDRLYISQRREKIISEVLEEFEIEHDGDDYDDEFDF